MSKNILNYNPAISTEAFIEKLGPEFKPVRITEKKLNASEIKDGYVYFTTDTQKIFLGLADGTKLSMGGNTGIFYGKKEINYPNDGKKPNPKVIFSVVTDIEGSRCPLVDDLILNIDGCFYRVKSVSEDNKQVNTERITLQGTGTGGTGTGGSGAPSFEVDVIGSQQDYYFASTGTTAAITFKGTSSDANNYIARVWWSFFSNPEEIIDEKFGLEWPMDTPYQLDLFPYLSRFSESGNTIIVYMKDKYGTERELQYKIYRLELQLSSEEVLLLPAIGNKLQYTLNISGGKKLEEKYIEYSLYDSNGYLYGESKKIEITPATIGNVPIDIDLAGVPHGSYTLKIQAKGKIGASAPESNVLEHKILRQVEGQGVLFDAFLPAEIQQYTDITISYLLVSDNVSIYPMEIELNTGEKPVSVNVTTNTLASYTMAPIDHQGVYTLTLRLNDLNISKQYEFTVTKYTGTMPVIDTTRTDLQFYLTAAGRNNNLVDRDEWESSTPGGTHTAYLSDFYYGNINGWTTDEEGASYLKLSQGAKMVCNTFKPFTTDAMDNLGTTIELDFKLSGVTDFDAELIQCYSTNQFGTITGGFAITGNQAKFFHSTKNTDETCIKFNLVEKQRIRLTYRIEPRSLKAGYPMILSYLNGICSNAEAYAKTDTLKDSSNPAVFKVDSTYGQVDLYSVRFYNNAIDESIILNNYLASFNSKEEKQKLYNSNAILDSNGNISLDLIEAEDYDLQIPYVKITGGFGCGKDFKMKAAADDEFRLPTGKKDYRLIDIDIIYPKNDYFAGYGQKDAEGNPTHRFSTKCAFADGKSVLNGYGEIPTSGGAMMYCQGTSSMEYPVKNLRIKWQDEKIAVRPDLPEVNLICFKADYMDSSGAHNTGAANLIDALYEGIHIQTPGQEHFADENLVTCIKGHPCIIFYSPTGESGSYEFIGKYNLNLDKATPEPFGFKYSSEDTDLEPTDSLTEADIKYGYLLDENGTIALSDGKKQNAIYCYEFLDNKVKVCNFLPEDGMTYYSTWYEDYYNKDEKKNMPGWTKGFESRYPEDRIGKDEADNLYELASWINELYVLRAQEENAGKNPADITYEYEYTLATGAFSDTVMYYEKVDDVYNVISLSSDTYKPNTYYTRFVKDKHFSMMSLERFYREYQAYFNKDFLLAYYVITEALHMMDSRVKNMMIATWGKEHRSYVDVDGNTQNVYHWIWYPIFYDMDTMLGLNNQGKPAWKYDDDDSNPLAFNGDDVLWNFVRDALTTEINSMYDLLEQDGGLKATFIIPKFNDNQGSMANAAMYNQDCKYKYINPYRTRYYDYLNEEWIEPGSMKYLYAAQGNRDLDREYYITNRILYLSGKRASTNYYNNKNNYITFRVNEPKVSAGADAEEQEKIRKTLEAVPISKLLDYTSLKTGYAGVLIGANGQLNNYRFEDEQTIEVECDTKGAGNTEAYLLGVNILSDLGDLSATYPEKFLIGGSIDCRLRRLQLGNSHRDYYNQAWQGVDAISFNTCTYLDEFEMSNCSEYKQPLDFSDNKVITKIYLTGNGTTSVTLPTGGILQELRLPAMTSLYIQSHPLLTDETFTFGYYDYDAENEIYPEKGHWVNDFSNLTTAQVVDTNIDTYNLLCNAPQLDTYQFNGFTWTLTEDNRKDLYVYVGRANEIDRDPTRDYYAYNIETGNYDLYTGDFNDSALLSIKSCLIENGEIKEIPPLEFLRRKSTVGNIGSAAALTGTIIISVEAAANEFNLFQKYIDIYPGVKIQYDEKKVDLTQAYSIDFYGAEEYSIGLSPYASYLSNGAMTWNDITKDLVPPAKSDNYFNYTFSGKWKEVIINTDNVISYGEEFDLKLIGNNYPPNKDLKLIPIFDKTPRLWNVEFYDDKGQKINSLSTALPYDAKNENGKTKTIAEHLSNKPLYFYYKDDSDLEDGKRYALQGWKSKTDYDNKTKNPVLIDLNSAYVQPKTLQYYAHYEIEDCLTTPSNQNIFIIESGNDNKLTLKINPVYKTVLQGKITLPAKSFKSNQIIHKISSDLINTNNLITHIYFENGSAYEAINNAAFQSCAELSYINLPDTIQSIGVGAFAFDKKLMLDHLPANLTSISMQAFWQCKKFTIATLPNSLSAIYANTFAECDNLQITEFGTENSGKGLTSIAKDAFAQSGKNVSGIIKLGRDNGQTLVIENGAFDRYGSNIAGIEIGKTFSGDYNSLGFNLADNATIIDGEE